MANIKFYFSLIILILNIGIINAQNTAYKCESIYDVLQSEEINSYTVTKKKYFYENCINKDGLCIKNTDGTYVIENDIVLVGKIKIDGVTSNSWCAAYIPSSYVLPKAIGWFLDLDNLQPIEKEKYQNIIGNWKSIDIEEKKEYDYSKVIEIFPIPNYPNVNSFIVPDNPLKLKDVDISIYGQSNRPENKESEFFEVGFIMDGKVFMTAKNRYVIITGEGSDNGDGECISDIIYMENEDKLYLNTRRSCFTTNNRLNNYSDFSDYYKRIIIE